LRSAVEALAESLRPRVIFRRPYVDEHSMLLERVHTMLEESRKYILFKAGRPIRNVLEDGAVENIHTTIYQGWLWDSIFLAEANDPMIGIHFDPSVTRCVGDSPYCHANHSAMLAMKAQELTEIEFKKGVTVQKQEFGNSSKKALGEFHRTGCSERARFLRVVNSGSPSMTVAELFFHLCGKVPGTHHHAPDTLRSQLLDQ
jgi:hypothetical protein